ncbi:hypothetical protein CWI39_0236p0010 [Hamiltosporidium magnivora]|uniref:Uncharacterized protein n=1 Tax=Hamiltosporidium magnivora TaxID=148818 RepID=A0A4Q9LJ43_9MICR|nr:hypothetical protein CWI39_0236p0010 [Hamiltosporidium magnivora]
MFRSYNDHPAENSNNLYKIEGESKKTFLQTNYFHPYGTHKKHKLQRSCPEDYATDRSFVSLTHCDTNDFERDLPPGKYVFIFDSYDYKDIYECKIFSEKIMLAYIDFIKPDALQSESFYDEDGFLKYTRNISTAKQMSIQEEDVTYKTKNNSILSLVYGTTPEEPTFNISEESDLEEERMVVY